MAGYNKEALQKIVNSYEKKIAKYKEQVKSIQDQQEKMMEFMKKFGVFSEDFMKKMMEQVGDAKGGMQQLAGLWGGRNVDHDRLRRMREDLIDDAGSGFTDNRVFVDVLAKQPGIVYRLNEMLFDDQEKPKVIENSDQRFNLKNLKNGKVGVIGSDTAGMHGDQNGQNGQFKDEDWYYYMEIKGELKKFEKFVVYDENGEMIYEEDLYDSHGNIKEDFFVFDHFYNRVDLNQLFDSQNKCKLKSKKLKGLNLQNLKNQSSSANQEAIYKDRQRQIFKELNKIIGTKWPGEMEAPSLKTEEFLSREVFEKFKDKLDREEILEKTCKVFFTELRSYIIERNKKRDALSEGILNPQMSLYTSVLEKLVKVLSDTRHEMEFYERPKRIKHITNEQLKEYSNRLRRMVGVYQKEKMRREIVLELRGDNPNLIVNLGDLDEDMIGLGNVKQELALVEKAKGQMKDIVEKNLLNLENWCKKKNFLEVLNVVESEIGREVDLIYEDNYNIQSFFYNYSSSVIKNSEILEKKVMFLSEQLIKKFVRREEHLDSSSPLRPFKVWKRRLSVRSLKEKYKRPMFKNMDALAQSDVMFLYRNIQNKLDNFVKVQKDVNRLGTIGNLDNIKDIITSFDQNAKGPEKKPSAEIYSDKKSSIEEEEEEEELPEEEQVRDNHRQVMEDEEDDDYEEEQVMYKPTKKKVKKRKKKKVRNSKEKTQTNMPENQNYNTLEYNPNLEKVYGVKTSSFVNKYTPYMSSTQQTREYRPSASTREAPDHTPRQRGYKTFSYKNQHYQPPQEHMQSEEELEEEEEEVLEEEGYNVSDYEDEGEGQYEEESGDHEYEGESQEDMESINDSDASDVSNPYNIDMRNVKMNTRSNISDEEGHGYQRNKQKRNSANLQESDLGAYYSSIAKGN